MKLPSEADILAAKKTAALRGTTAELITYEELDVCVIALAFTVASYSAYLDAAQRNVSDAKDAVYAEHVVWPAAEDADAYAERIPALTSKVCGDLATFAGDIDPKPVLTKLTADTPASALTRAGLTAEKAASLLAQYNQPGQLTIARFPTLDMSAEGKGFALVVKVPAKAVYRARLDVYQKATSGCSGVWDAAAQAARDFVVWSSEGDLDAVLSVYPGIVAIDLITLFSNLGGAKAKGERRRL